MNFAEYLRERRIALGLTMRQFAQNKGYDVGYVSRLENGLLSAPADTEKLKALAIALELKENTTHWVEFFDLAAASRHEIPTDLRDNPVVPRLLPAFYRTLRKEKITDEEIDHLARLIRGDSDEQAPTTGESPSTNTKIR